MFKNFKPLINRLLDIADPATEVSGWTPIDLVRSRPLRFYIETPNWCSTATKYLSAYLPI